jgi:hypothetical protein
MSRDRAVLTIPAPSTPPNRLTKTASPNSAHLGTEKSTKLRRRTQRHRQHEPFKLSAGRLAQTATFDIKDSSIDPSSRRSNQRFGWRDI